MGRDWGRERDEHTARLGHELAQRDRVCDRRYWIHRGTRLRTDDTGRRESSRTGTRNASRGADRALAGRTLHGRPAGARIAAGSAGRGQGCDPLWGGSREQHRAGDGKHAGGGTCSRGEAIHPCQHGGHLRDHTACRDRRAKTLRCAGRAMPTATTKQRRKKLYSTTASADCRW